MCGTRRDGKPVVCGPDEGSRSKDWSSIELLCLSAPVGDMCVLCLFQKGI